MRPAKRSALLAAVLLAVATAPAARARAVEEKPIQPGAIMFSPAGQCTMNFVFADDEGSLYIATAGHCVASIGTRAESSQGEFGTVVFREQVLLRDFALIRIDPGRYGDVSPAMRRWGGPTGFTTPPETLPGTAILLHGYGIGFGESEATRARAGLLYNDSARSYQASAPANFGDSGGPVLHAATGKAVGVATMLGLPPSLLQGPTIQDFLGRLDASGFRVHLLTAPYSLP